MVVVMKERAREAQIELVVARLVEMGMDVHRSTGVTRTVLGALNWPYQWYSRDGQLSPAELAELVADMALRSIRA